MCQGGIAITAPAGTGLNYKNDRADRYYGSELCYFAPALQAFVITATRLRINIFIRLIRTGLSIKGSTAIGA
jgi:hypothetical protein